MDGTKYKTQKGINMNEIDTLDRISKTSGLNAKIELMKNNETEELKELLVYAYDSFKVYGIKNLKFSLNDNTEYNPTLHKEFINILEMLQHTNVNDVVRSKVKDFLEKCPKLQQDIYYKILTKDLTIGITAKSVNKAFKGLIREFKLMKADAFTDQNLDRKLVVQPKFDGYRCLIVKDGDTIISYTSSGKVIPLKTIEKELSKVEGSFVLDGELVSTSRTGTSTVCNRLIKGNNTVDDDVLIYNVFDFINFTEFVSGVYKEVYNDRLENLDTFGYDNDFNHIRITKSYITTNTEEVMNLYKSARKNKEEGIMIKDLDYPYELKRSQGMLKLKALNSCTLRIVNFVEHSKKKNTLGAFTCVSEDEAICVSVGGGFSDEEREVFWKDKDKLINTCVEVLYNEIQYTKDRELFLFLPRFKELRPEKEEADMMLKILEECQ